MANKGMGKAARMYMMAKSRQGGERGRDGRERMGGEQNRQYYNYDMNFTPDYGMMTPPMGYGHEYSARHMPENYDAMPYADRSEMGGEREMGHERRYRMSGGRMRDSRGRFRSGSRQRARHIEPEMEEYDEYEEDDEEEVRRKPVRAGGTFWMDAPKKSEKLTRAKAEEWVENMENEDPAKPEGGKWTMEQVKPIAQKLGIQPDTQKFIDFYAMMNAMYSDYYEVAKKFNVATPDFFAEMAKAFVCDKDAVKNKTAMYYEYIVQH